ncbi:hypothetical protein MKX01_034648 [Papaver californicum]|nr:hypothetical protein MKX01_034648 [Papaver californicum]
MHGLSSTVSNNTRVVHDYGGVGSSSSVVAAQPQQVSAMFVFGDSRVDNGNNNHLASWAKSNYEPYGIDFNQGPTGRFFFGGPQIRQVIDLLGDLLGLPYIPAHASVDKVEMMLRGVNYASAAGGLLDVTVRDLGDRFSLGQHVSHFTESMNQIRNEMGTKMNMSEYLSMTISTIISCQLSIPLVLK